MKPQGSVLVVVLGLLAILAVIGVTFLTMSSLERATANSFALQTQLMLAADGALDYAIHQMILDVWEYSVSGNTFAFRNPPGLLTGNLNAGVTPISYCEPFDYPSAADDPWLSAPIVSQATPSWISFDKQMPSRFGIAFGSNANPNTWPDNLGFPDGGVPNGIWIADTAISCEQYVGRASLTILDHNALLNLNAHGNTSSGAWEYGDCIGKGYFVSDPVPPVSDLNALLVGTGGVPGCWGSDGPGNSRAGAILIENPAAAGTGVDVPYTLDEEFELRNLQGTYFKSRLERIWSAVLSDPSKSSGYTPRLKVTTVSWTAAVRGGDPTGSHVTMKNAAGADQGWSAAKADLNTASAQDIYEALRDGQAWEDSDELKQLVANIVAFRRKSAANFTPVSIGGKNFYGAQRQPFFTEATCSLTSSDESDPNNIKRTYTVKIEVYNPWPGDWDGDTGGLTTQGLTVSVKLNAGHSVSPATPVSLPGPKMTIGCFVPADFVVTCNNDKTLKDAVQDIRLAKDPLILDRIGGTDLQTLQEGHITRKVFRTGETRGSKDNSEILVLYVSDWQTGGSVVLGSVTSDSSIAGSAIPIRFPNCSPAGAKNLRVRAPTGTAFKAFPRVGDLNQVLRFAPGGEPWIVTVSKTSRTDESNVKFDWRRNIGNITTPGAVAAARAANLLCVGGPWQDDLDNDGDGYTDFADNGKPDAGQPGGPEFRVAGLINLNTAIPETLSALGLTSLPGKPIRSPAQVIPSSATPTGIEDRDEVFTRISNIATVRSDTFSVYGTVQIVDPRQAVYGGNIPARAVMRSRRFWALVDRSPSLAYPPTSKENFIYPRILNFQWLD